MTRDQFIYLISTDYKAGESTPGWSKNLHTGDIKRHVEMAFSEVVSTLYDLAYKQSYTDSGKLDPITKTFLNNEVMYDNDRCEYFIQLPVDVVQLPMNRGIRMVFGAKSQKRQFIYTPNNSLALYDIIGEFDGRGFTEPSYYVEGDKLFIDFYTYDPFDVSVKLIPDFTSYEGDDEVPVAFGKDGIMYDMVMARLRNRNRIHDDQDDANSKQILQ